MLLHETLFFPQLPMYRVLSLFFFAGSKTNCLFATRIDFTNISRSDNTFHAASYIYLCTFWLPFYLKVSKNIVMSSEFLGLT